MLKNSKSGMRLLLAASGMVLIAVLIWQAIVSRGVPDPSTQQPQAVALVNISLLVFREALEFVLVLAAIMANMVDARAHYRKPVVWGAVAGFVCSVGTWFVAAGIVDDLLESVSALHMQAATGLLAIIVLLIIMNWFFHKVYWGGWISLHNRKKRELLHEDQDETISRSRLLFGLAMLGFFSMYREGFEVVLFLQSYRLKMGGAVVLGGAAFGLYLGAIVAVLTFIAHQKLPYRKMLIFTGVMLAMVLMVMVGEQVQEMQLAGWMSTTEIPLLASIIPEWMGMWFGIFPNAEGLALQTMAMVLVGGSYFAARKTSSVKQKKQAESNAAAARQPSLVSAHTEI